MASHGRNGVALGLGIVAALSGCATVRSEQPQTSKSCCGSPRPADRGALAPCPVEPGATPLVPTKARGVELALPADAEGPYYDSDDFFAGRPWWENPHWEVHFVFGNGGLTEFMADARCCSMDDERMLRKVCVGTYMEYGAMADIARTESRDKVSSMSVTIEREGLTEADALAIIRSAVTNWEIDTAASD